MKTKAQHTPGPWSVSTDSGGKGGIKHNAGGYVCFTCMPCKIPDEREGGESWIDMRDRTRPIREAIFAQEKANARLIAAAPDLLMELENAIFIAESWIHDQLDGTSRLDGALAELGSARAAIAKAKGER